MSLSSLITARLKELDLTPAAVARKFEIAYQPFVSAMAGKSLPNARTFKKYAKLLGISADKVGELVAAEKGSGKTGRGRPRRARTTGRGRGPRAARIDGIAKSLHAVAETVAKVEGILGDELAVRVNALSAAHRRIIEAMITGLR